VAEAVRISLGNAAHGAMMAEQRAPPGGSHGSSTLAAFQGNEQGVRVGEGPFQTQIFFEDLENLRWQGQNAFFVSFAEHPHLGIGQLQIRELQSQHLAASGRALKDENRTRLS